MAEVVGRFHEFLFGTGEFLEYDLQIITQEAELFSYLFERAFDDQEAITNPYKASRHDFMAEHLGLPKKSRKIEILSEEQGKASKENMAKKTGKVNFENKSVYLRPGGNKLGIWQEEANCLGVEPELFYPERGASTREAKDVCRGCTVRDECLEYALVNSEKFGIWGGLSERERRRLRRQRAKA